jgi:hypothetical protein
MLKALPTCTLQDALAVLDNKITDSRRSRDDFLGVLSTVLLYVSNAAKNPGEAKFRRVRAANKAFQARDRNLPGLCTPVQAWEQLFTKP